MKRLQLITTIILLLISTAVFSKGFYGGIKAGAMDSDVSDLDSTVNGGIFLGYNFLDGKTTASVEVEYSDTMSDGDVDGFSGKGEWDIRTTAIYGVMRHGEKIYFKAKAGWVEEEISISVPGISVDGSDTGGSAGIGVGYRIDDNISAEAEFTVIEEDVNFFSVGINYQF